MVGCLGKPCMKTRQVRIYGIPYSIMVISEVETSTVPVLLKESDKLFWKQELGEGNQQNWKELIFVLAAILSVIMKAQLSKTIMLCLHQMIIC